jgi:hypothetical protein
VTISRHPASAHRRALDYLDGRPVAALTYRHRLHVVNLFEWRRPTAGDAKPGARDAQRLFDSALENAAGSITWLVSDCLASGPSQVRGTVFGT